MNKLLHKRYASSRVRDAYGIILFVAAFLMITGCASTHNLKTDGENILGGGGGFIDEELRPGLHKMTAVSNRAIWPSFSAAIDTWRMRANQLCGKDAYETIETVRSDGMGMNVPLMAPGVMVAVPSFNAAISGYVVCHSSGMTVVEARVYVQKQQDTADRAITDALNAELVKLGGGRCEQLQYGVSGETYFRCGRTLMSLKRYADAMSCFRRTQEVDTNTYFAREACMSLGLMYEVGLGVDKNLQTAREWYKKAGI